MFPRNYFPRSYFPSPYFVGGATSFTVVAPAASVAIIEMEFSGKGNGWTVVPDWMTANGIQCHRGFSGSGTLDRVAEIGQLSFTLNNAPNNSAGLVGYYSPNHANRRAGFELNIGVRYRIDQNIRFTGILDAIRPTSGSYGPRTVSCDAVDWMDTATRKRLTNLPVLVDKRGDELFQTLIDALTTTEKPLAVEKGLSADIFPYTLDRTRDEQTVLYDEFYRLALSGMDRIWIRGNGTLVYESRTKRPATVSSVDTYTDSSGFVAAQDRNTGIVNRVESTIHPRLPATVSVVMYSLNQPVAIVPGTPLVMLGPWTDPANPDARVGAVSLDTVTPTTDYVANSLADGTGTDLTGSLGVTVGLSGNATTFTITLSGSTSGFITKLQQRGKPLYDYGSSILGWQDDVSLAKYGPSAEQIDMTYQADPRFGLEVAQYIVYLYAFPTTQISGLIRVVDLGHDAVERSRSLDRDISDRIRLVDPVTGIDKSFFINAISETVIESQLRTEFLLGPADSTAFWQLEVPGSSELDLTTTLGFGLIVGHADVAHQDAHSDVAFSDVAHIDTHTDNPHQDTTATHADIAHTDTAHSDVSHLDAHFDTAHTDVVHSDSHSDVAHNDVAHSDSHGDAHTDFPSDPTVPIDHGDVPHWDEHFDSHGDSSHVDTHSDVAHSDVAHVDDHFDRVHSDVIHSDAVHSDHTDASHTDTVHGDVAHVDVIHSDVLHGDTHDDVEHGDMN